jgi:NAD(P)-dependent dehydrogenase (short-subunit alcohol dehydrogenase family)
MNKILILGASTGIGAALARFFVKNGYDVHGCARREPENWEDVGTTTKIVCNASDSKEFKANVVDYFEKDNFPHIIINCIGVGGGELFMSLDYERFTKSISANLITPIYVQNELVKKASLLGVNLTSFMFSSLAVEVVQPGNSIYAGAKLGMSRLHKGMAVEYQKFGHLFYTLTLSLIEDTPMVRGLPDKFRIEYENRLMYSAVSVEELSKLITYLIENRPVSLSGTEIQVGGTK